MARWGGLGPEFFYARGANVSKLVTVMSVAPQDSYGLAIRNKKIVALQRAIVALFDDGRWRELGYLTNSIDAIQSHSRLLRSLSWGDDDYPGCVFQILPRVLGPNDVNMSVVENFVGLEAWLRENDPRLHSELYGDPTIPLEQVEAASTVLDVSELNRHAARIRRGIQEDPEQALGSAKELLESVLRTILEDHAAKPYEDIPALLKRAQQKLGLDPKSAQPGAETLRRTLSNLGQVVVGVAELRTLYGTGHGRSKVPELEIAHVRLTVNAAISVASFLVEVWQDEIKARSIF
jgi:hypothetical protein